MDITVTHVLSMLFSMFSGILIILIFCKSKDYTLLAGIITRFLFSAYTICAIFGVIPEVIHLPTQSYWLIASIFLSDIVLFLSRYVGTYLGIIPEYKRRYMAIKNNYRTLIDSSPAGVYVTALDGTIEYVNKALQDMSGYSHQELIGTSILNYLAEEDIEPTKQVFRDRATKTIVSDSYERTIICKSGSRLRVRVFSNATENGHPTITGSVIPVTERSGD